MIEGPDPHALFYEEVLQDGHVHFLLHLDHADGSEAAHVAHAGHGPAGFKSFFKFLLNGFHALLPGRGGKQIKARAGRGAEEGIAHEGRPVHEHAAAFLRSRLFYALCHAGGGEDGAACHHSARESLAHAHDIRRNAGPLAGEKLSCPPEARGDFVTDEQAAVLIAEFTQPFKIVRMVDPHAARALHNGLEDDGGYLVLPFGEDAPRRVEALRIEGLVEAAGGAFHKNVLRQEPGEETVHAVHGIADAHGALRVAVIAAHGREEMPARAAANGNLVLHGHFEGYFHGHGSGIRVKDVLQPLRHHGEQALPEFHGRPVGQSAEHDMAHGADLPGHGVLERGIPVAVDGAPPRGHPVDELRAVREHDAVVMGARRGVHGKRIER